MIPDRSQSEPKDSIRLSVGDGKIWRALRGFSSAHLLYGQKFDLHIAACDFESIVRSHENIIIGLGSKLHCKGVEVGNLPVDFDERRAYRPVSIGRNDCESESREALKRQIHGLRAV